MSNINDRIKEIRTEVGFTQAEFASTINLSREYVSKLENGKEKPSKDTINLICLKYNIETTWLETGLGKKKCVHRKIDKYKYILNFDVLREWLQTNNYNEYYIFYNIINTLIEMMTYESVKENSRLYYCDKINQIIATIFGYVKLHDMEEIDDDLKKDLLKAVRNQFNSFLQGIEESFIEENLDDKLVDKN